MHAKRRFAGRAERDETLNGSHLPAKRPRAKNTNASGTRHNSNLHSLSPERGHTQWHFGANRPKWIHSMNTLPAWSHPSPWLDPRHSNLFKDEFQMAKENLPYKEFKPLEIYDWILRHDGDGLFFRALDRLAPMFPLVSYGQQVAVWTSPPPSGKGNAIFLVLGHDKTGALRLVGGNYFTEPRMQFGTPLPSVEFFKRFDNSSNREKQDLVRDVITQTISCRDMELLRSVSRECEHFHTMAIYVVALTGNGALFHASKAVIEGENPVDFSLEYFGEIK